MSRREVNGSGILMQSYSDLSWQSVGCTPGKVQYGVLGPDVPEFQQSSLLELVVSFKHLGTSPVNGIVIGSRMFHQGKLISAC